MALKNLSLESMIALSDAWLDPKRGRKALAALPHVAGLLTKLEAAHQAALATQRSSNTTEVLTAIQAEQAEVDALHDRKARGLHQALTAVADLTDDAERAQSLLQLRDRLFPDGLSVVRASYLDQAGAAKLAAERVRKEDRAHLHSIAFDGQKLDDALDAWLGAAARLATLDAKRASLGEVVRQDVPDRGEILQARFQWIRTVNALVAAIELEDDVPAEVTTLVLARLRDAEARVERRNTTKPAPVEDAPTP